MNTPERAARLLKRRQLLSEEKETIDELIEACKKKRRSTITRLLLGAECIIVPSETDEMHEKSIDTLKRVVSEIRESREPLFADDESSEEEEEEPTAAA